MPERILLFQLADIGDLILTIPAIIALREAHPDAHLTLIASGGALPVLEDGLVDEIIRFDKRGFNGSLSLFNPANWRRLSSLRDRQYDALIFFHKFTLWAGTLKFALVAYLSGATRVFGVDNGNGWFLTDRIADEGFGAKHQAQYWLDLVGLLGGNTKPRRASIAFHDGVLPLMVKHKQRVVIHAGGGGYSQARRWSTEKLAQVADALHEEFGAEIVLVGTPQDEAAAVAQAMKHQAVNLTGQTSITELADVLRSADLYIGTDSGVTHLAAAVRTPVVAIYGPSNHEAWGPWSPGGNVVVVRSAPLCSPCMYVDHGIGLREGCPALTCMKMVTVNQVLQAARHILRDEVAPQFQGYPNDARSGRDWQDRINILGLPVDRITYTQWIEVVDNWIKRGFRAHQVCTTNPEFMMIAQHDPNFANILRRADLCLPDGVGLLWAAKVLKTPLPERVTGSDGVRHIAKAAAERGWRLFLLGAAPGIAEQAAAILEEENPGLQIAGTYAGSPAPEEEAEIVARINASNAHILLVAYGAPKQDEWIARNLPRLRVKMAMGVGGSFDFIAGKVPRAPQWMQDYGLEWAFRLYKEPRRFWRMLRLPRFVFAVIMRGSR